MYRSKRTETSWNGRIRLEWTGIWSNVEQEGDSFRFKDWYEIFQPERNGINNNAK